TVFLEGTIFAEIRLRDNQRNHPDEPFVITSAQLDASTGSFAAGTVRTPDRPDLSLDTRRRHAAAAGNSRQPVRIMPGCLGPAGDNDSGRVELFLRDIAGWNSAGYLHDQSARLPSQHVDSAVFDRFDRPVPC